MDLDTFRKEMKVRFMNFSSRDVVGMTIAMCEIIAEIYALESHSKYLRIKGVMETLDELYYRES